MTRIVLFLLLLSILRIEAATDPSQRIDELIAANLAKHEVKPNAPIDDATFLRRAYLNIGGRIPTIAEGEAFRQMPEEDRRSQLIAKLLNSEAFVSHYYNYWADILRLEEAPKTQLGNTYIHFRMWIKDAIRNNKPYDEFVREIVGAHGMSWDKGTIAYYMRDRGMPLDNMANTVRIFLGTRLECAQCHDHPFDKWSQKDFFQMAAYSYPIASFFNGQPLHQNRNRYLTELQKRAETVYLRAVGKGDDFPVVQLDTRDETKLDRYIRSRSGWANNEWIGPTKGVMSTNEFRELVLKGWAAADEILKLNEGARMVAGELYRPLAMAGMRSNDRDLKLPHDYQYDDAKPLDLVSPETMFGGSVAANSDRHQQLENYARWMTSKNTPRFTRVIVNRLWKFAFGVGLFEPVDNLTDFTKISNPELLYHLEKVMIDSGFDTKRLLEVIFNTRAWQRAVQTEEIIAGKPYHFPGPKLRRMTAEQIWDSLATLSIANPDEYRPNERTHLIRLEKERLQWSSVEGADYGKLVALMDEYAPRAAHIAAERRRLAFAALDAAAQKDRELGRQLRRESRQLMEDFKDSISERGWPDLTVAEASGAFRDIKGTTPGTVFRIPPFQTPPPPESIRITERKGWVRSERQKAEQFRRAAAKMARASEQRMPAPRGHFLREFGQSDRELIENGSDRPSATQALALMNGGTIDLLTSRYSVFGGQVVAAQTPDAKVRIIFQGMLSREPSARELEISLAKLEKTGRNRDVASLVWAVLNTQQFLFVE